MNHNFRIVKSKVSYLRRASDWFRRHILRQKIGLDGWTITTSMGPDYPLPGSPASNRLEKKLYKILKQNEKTKS